MRILALDIGGTAIKIGVFDENGRILSGSERPTYALEGGAAVMQRILDIIGEYEKIDRVGISASGQIDYRLGRVIYATDNIPGWTGMEIKNIVESCYSIPASVENDVNAAALGEAFYGSAKEIGSFICMTYGTGIGGAIIENGRVYRGAFGSAGEFGHIITHVDGRKCTCGGVGCYETYASTSSLVGTVREKLGIDSINGKDIFRYVMGGDKTVIQMVDEWIKEVMMGLVSILYIYNPSFMILGGGIMTEKYILEHIRGFLPQYVMENYRKVEIIQTALGNSAGLLGAFHCALKQEDC